MCWVDPVCVSREDYSTQGNTTVFKLVLDVGSVWPLSHFHRVDLTLTHSRTRTRPRRSRTFIRLPTDCGGGTCSLIPCVKSWSKGIRKEKPVYIITLFVFILYAQCLRWMCGFEERHCLCGWRYVQHLSSFERPSAQCFSYRKLWWYYATVPHLLVTMWGLPEAADYWDHVEIHVKTRTEDMVSVTSPEEHYCIDSPRLLDVPTASSPQKLCTPEICWEFVCLKSYKTCVSYLFPECLRHEEGSGLYVEPLIFSLLHAYFYH